MTILYYVHDPMCSWCYAFAPVWERIQRTLPPELEVEYVLGGLAPDTSQPMPPDTRAHIEHTWRRIQNVVPGTVFNFDFWVRGTPRRATYDACRAVLTAKHFDPALERSMIAAVQRAYYREARNPADVDTLVELASEIGLDPRDFRAWHARAACEALLQQHIRRAVELGVRGFPSLVLGAPGGPIRVPHSYTDPGVALDSLQARLTAAGRPAAAVPLAARRSVE